MSLSRKQIDALEPRERRFDVALTQDFVISVHPNGIKTWAFIDERAGQLHRKTLGVWPEMDIDAAQKAVAAARKTRARMVAAAQDASAVPSPVAKTVPAGYRQDSNTRPAWLAPAVLAGALALGIAGWLLGPQLLTAQVSTTTSSTDAVNASVEDSVVSARPVKASREPAISNDGSQPVADSGEPITVASGTADEAIQSPAGFIAQPGPQQEPAFPSSASPGAESRQATGAVSTRSQPAETASVLASGGGSQASQSTRAATPATPVSAASGNVQRALLSSGIENREPVDVLDGKIAVNGDGPATLYYFNDLRRMTGRTVSHRWIKDGAVVSQRNMTIGGWRWRLYSSIDLPPDASGEWSVQLLDENGSELHRQDFTLLRGLP